MKQTMMKWAGVLVALFCLSMTAGAQNAKSPLSGSWRTGYFYNKYMNEGGDASEAHLFQYPGPKPRTREQVILMLCDSIEAASRTLKDYTPQAFDAFVEKIVSGKEEEGQLLEAEISVKELCKVKEVLKSYLSQMYHERIEYPNRKNKK